MKIVFMGTPDFACPPLRAIYESDHVVVAVVTGPDKPSGRGKKVMPTPVATLAEEKGSKTLKPESLKDDQLLEDLKALEADLFVVVAFRILPKKLFTLPRLGSINIHGSLLPKYRGAAPINWALINGEKETGLSAFYLKSKVDTGDIILREKTVIENNENFDSLYNRMSVMAGDFLLKTLDLIENNQAHPLQQNESKASAAPKISPFDALIDFGFPAINVNNFVRGLSTKPGAYTFFRNNKLKILESKPAELDIDKQTRPGTIIQNRKKLIVACANSALEITKVVPQGKKAMDGISFINGFKPEIGEIIGEVPKDSELTK